MHAPNPETLYAHVVGHFFYLFGMANNYYIRSWCIQRPYVSGTTATSEKVIYAYRGTPYVIIWYFKGKKMKVDILIWPDIMMVNCEDSYSGYDINTL